MEDAVEPTVHGKIDVENLLPKYVYKKKMMLFLNSVFFNFNS